MDEDVKIISGGTIRPRLALASNTNACAFVDAGRGVDSDSLAFVDPAFATADTAWVLDDFTATPMRRFHSACFMAVSPTYLWFAMNPVAPTCSGFRVINCPPSRM